MAVTTVYTVWHPRPAQPSAHGNERTTVGATVAQLPQPAVMVASRTQAAVTHVLQMSVVDTTAAHPETEKMDTDGVAVAVTVTVSWARTRAAALGGVSLWWAIGGSAASAGLQGHEGLESLEALHLGCP